MVKDPYQLKFRTLKKTNKLIQNNVMQIGPCLQFMKAIGFQEKEETLEMQVVEVPYLVFLEECLDQLIVKYGGNKIPIPRPKEEEESRFIKFSELPGSEKEMKEQFSE